MKGLKGIFSHAGALSSATASISEIINIIDGAYALMAIPTMTSALLLAPKVREAAKDYFARLHK
jgi:AGCS family alanine or glycine:cation symporter